MRKHNWKNICHRNTHCSQWGRHVVIVGIGVQELCRFPWVAWEPMSHHNPLSQWDDPTVTCHTHCSQHVVTYRHAQAQRYSQQGKKPDRNSSNQTSQHNFILRTCKDVLQQSCNSNISWLKVTQPNLMSELLTKTLQYFWEFPVANVSL